MPMTEANAVMLALSPGIWRAQGAVLTIGAQQSRIEVGNGAAVTDGPLRMDLKGNFKTTGKFESYAPGPQAADRPPVMHKARIEGRATGDTVTLTIHVDGERAMRRFVFTQGRVAKLVRPL